MNLLIIDTETTGTDHTKDSVIEVAAILYSVEYRAVIQQISFLLPAENNPAEAINKIPVGILPGGMLHCAYFDVVQNMAFLSDYVVAHNADFDKAFLSEGIGLELIDLDDEPLPWLDTMDMPFPNSEPGSNLVKLALSQGVPVVSAHRALTDCQLIASIFSKQNNLDELIRIAAQPRRVVKALVGYHDRSLAYDAGFKFDRLVPRAWARKMTQEEIDGFDTRLFDLEVVA